MAESVVSFLLDKIGLFLDEERQLLSGVREEAEFVRNELDHIRVFLRKAESMEERDPQAGVWIKQVRDIAFEIEDVLDEFLLRLARDREDGSPGFISRITRSIKNVKYRHQIASEIRVIKRRIINVFDQRNRYKLDDSEPDPSSVTVNPIWCERRADALLLEDADLVGIDKPKKQLIKWLINDDPTFKVISVVGMGGLGKTTLVRKVYDDDQVKKIFKYHCLIIVSQSPKIEKLLKHIISQLCEQSNQSMSPTVETMANHDLKAKIKGFLQESKYLLVFDDVWNTQAWDAIKYALPRNNYGSRVMLTTRISDVASSSCVESKGKVYSLKPLSFEDSRILFCKRTFQENMCPSHLENVVKYILERCEGLPLAIVAISGLLATKDRERIEEWEMVKRNFGSELEGDKLRSMETILLLSYYDLPHRLKACLLYTSAFPEDYKIDRIRLIRLWIAEGFVEERDGKTLEDVAENYLNELLDRSLIQVMEKYSDGRIRVCHIHDVLREVILRKSKDQNFVIMLNEHNRKGPDLNARRLSVHNTRGTVGRSGRARNLRSLFFFDVGDFPSNTSICDLFGGDLRLLKVLDLRGTKLEIFPNEIVKMYHLTYLSLRNTKVKDLPTSIGKLQKLETLDLKGTRVTKMPPTIVKLRCLRHLLVYHRSYFSNSIGYEARGFEALSEIGCLGSLQHLSKIEVNRETGAGVIEEIGKLSQLTKLRIGKLRTEDGAILCSSIERLTNLRTLHIELLDGEIIDLQHISSPPQFLQRLLLTGPLETVPQWMTSLQNLTKLCLNCTLIRGDLLATIQDLPNLGHLLLNRAIEGEMMHFKAGGFQKLKRLNFSDLQGLRRVEVEKGAMPRLEELYIERCELLEKLPLGIEFLSNLKNLALGRVSEYLINSIDRNKGGEDYWKIEHVTEVDLYHFKDGEWAHGKRLPSTFSSCSSA